MSPLHYPQQATPSFELTTRLSQINLNTSSITQFPSISRNEVPPVSFEEES